MSKPPLTVLVVGATGSIGRLVVEEVVKNGHAVRALALDARKARRLLPLQEEPQQVRRDLDAVKR